MKRSTKGKLSDAPARHVARYRELVQLVNSAIIAWKSDGTITFFNEYAQSFFGYRAEEVIGKHVGLLVPERDASGADLSTLARDIVAHPERYANNENKNVCRDGRVVWMTWTNLPLLGPGGEVREILAVGTDITERKQTERALALSEARFRLACQAADAGAWEWDLQTGSQVWSEELWRLYGLSPRSCEPSWESWRQSVHPDDRDLVAEAVRTASREARGLVAEWRVCSADGAVRWLMLRSQPQHDCGGNLSRYCGIVVDITTRKEVELEMRRHRDQPDALVKERTAELEARNCQLMQEAEVRKQAQFALSQSEQRYRSIVENQTLYIDRYLPGGYLTYVNDALARLVGVAPDQLLGSSFFPFIHEDDRAQVIHTIESLDVDNPIAVVNSRVVLSGVTHWHQWEQCALFDDAGRIVEYQSVGRDITVQREAELALVESELRYRAVVEDLTELITRYRPDGSYVFVNDAFCRFFEKSLDEVVGRNWLPEVHAEDIPLVENQLRLLTPTNPVVVIENRVVAGSGAVRWMQFVNRGFFNARGQMYQTQAVGRDITERREAEETLKRYAQRLIALEEELRKRIAIELHDDISQTLTALSFNLAHIGNNLPADIGGDLREALKDSRVFTKEITRNVRDLMLELRPSQPDVLGLQAAVRSYVETFATRNGIAAEVLSDPRFPRLSAKKETVLFRITQEALNNVTKHAAATKVAVHLHCCEALVRLVITDNGKGGASLHAGPQAVGSGWGLAIMSERAKLIRGKLQLDSKAGQGTTVAVEVKRGR
jgi:PAS domain S-box-containing protein